MQYGGSSSSWDASTATTSGSLASPESKPMSPSRRTSLDNVQPWHWSPDEVARSPSVEDGMSHNEVLSNKHYAFTFIEEMRTGMKFLPIITITAMTLFHRFYHYQSMTEFKWKEMSRCCLFAALKIEEKVIKMENLLKWAHQIWNKMKKMTPAQIEAEKLDVHGREFFEMKEQLQYNERILLQTIGFEVSMTHPPFLIIRLIKALRQKSPIYNNTWAKNTAKVAVDWSVCSSGSELCLTHHPEVLAVAFVYGAAHDVIGALEHPSDEVRMWHLWDELSNLKVTEHVLHSIMVELHAYMHRFKEPRVYWRQKDAAAKGLAPPPSDDVVKPPKDPASYHPDALRVARLVTAVGVATTAGVASTVGSVSLYASLAPADAIIALPPTATTATATAMSHESMLRLAEVQQSRDVQERCREVQERCREVDTMLRSAEGQHRVEMVQFKVEHKMEVVQHKVEVVQQSKDGASTARLAGALASASACASTSAETVVEEAVTSVGMSASAPSTNVASVVQDIVEVVAPLQPTQPTPPHTSYNSPRSPPRAPVSVVDVDTVHTGHMGHTVYTTVDTSVMQVSTLTAMAIDPPLVQAGSTDDMWGVTEVVEDTAVHSAVAHSAVAHCSAHSTTQSVCVTLIRTAVSPKRTFNLVAASGGEVVAEPAGCGGDGKDDWYESRCEKRLREG